MAFYGPTWNNANRVMPDSGKRKVNISIYGTDRHDHTPSPVSHRTDVSGHAAGSLRCLSSVRGGAATADSPDRRWTTDG